MERSKGRQVVFNSLCQRTAGFIRSVERVSAVSLGRYLYRSLVYERRSERQGDSSRDKNLCRKVRFVRIDDGVADYTFLYGL